LIETKLEIANIYKIFHFDGYVIFQHLAERHFISYHIVCDIFRILETGDVLAQLWLGHI